MAADVSMPLFLDKFIGLHCSEHNPRRRYMLEDHVMSTTLQIKSPRCIAISAAFIYGDHSAQFAADCHWLVWMM